MADPQSTHNAHTLGELKSEHIPTALGQASHTQNNLPLPLQPLSVTAPTIPSQVPQPVTPNLPQPQVRASQPTVQIQQTNRIPQANPIPSPSRRGLFGRQQPLPQINRAGNQGGRPVKPRPGPQQPKQKLDPNSREYLMTLNPTDLRKEVIKTEIEIQKTLIESEKAYREGISTIRDLIAPSSVKITTGQLELGTKIVRSFFVLTYPKIINTGWLEGMVNADIPMDLSIFIYPRDSSEVLKELKGKVGKIQASLQLNAERGQARDPMLESGYRDVEGLRDAITQGVEKFFRVGVYITIYADNADQLEKYSQAVEGILSQQSIIMKRAALQMDDGFNSSLPLLKDDLDVLNNMNTSPLSACFPFVSSELSSDSGILYGINRHNTSLIIFDRFELENANSLIFATSGAGKSYTVKLEILRSLMLGVAVIVIDPEQEYKILADTLGGAYINMSLNSSNRINPFDLPRPMPGENTGDILRTAVIDLLGLLNLMLGKMDPQETSIMERAIQEAYSKRDITAQSDLNNITPPTMSDLVDILNGIVGGESLAQRLYRFTEGTFAGIFNQRTNININNNFVVYNIRDLQESLRPIAMYVLLKYVWNEIRSTLKRRILAIDEAWIMMQYEDSARFLYGLAKRARKYYLGITTITQDVGDFMQSPFGKPIVTNAAMKILLKQSTAAIDNIGDTFALTTGEKQVLLQSEVGQGIFFAGPRHVAIEIVAFPTEHRIITTNPKDILKMQGLSEE
jgi:conjugal transfer ATP-binding protein TraC